MSTFHEKVLLLTRVYEWQKAILSLVIEAHAHIIISQFFDATSWSIREKFQARFCNLLIVQDSFEQNRRRRSRSLASTRRIVFINKTEICDRFNERTCSWHECFRIHKCKKCERAEHERKSCSQKKWEFDAEDMIAINEFLNSHTCVPASTRSNTKSLFRLVDVSRSSLQNFSFLLRSTTWATLLKNYSEVIRIHLSMILQFEAQIDHTSSKRWIIFNNLTSVEIDSKVINNKIANDLKNERIVAIQSIFLFIFFSLSLISKEDEEWRRIHHLSHFETESINDHISQKTAQLRYTKLEKIL
jgi:hypothetical protein